MNKAWKCVYNRNALRDIPPHQMSCWSKQGFEERFSLLKKIIPETISSNYKTALDVGCGPGIYCQFLQELDLKVTGVDYSDETLQLAKKNFPNIRFQIADANNLPFKDKSYDLVLCIGLLQCVQDYKVIINELIRVTDKILILSTLKTNKWPFSPDSDLNQQLKYDSWPTRKFHPNNLIPLIEKKGFSVELIENNVKGKPLDDCFFLVCKKLKQ